MDRSLHLILYWFILGFYNLLSTVSGNAEGDALNALKKQLGDPNNILQSWNATLVNPCTWYHVTCNNDNSVTRVDLGNASLTGQLVPQLGELVNLQYLEVFGNNITGKIPKELGNLRNLVSLDLYMNRLEGHIPRTLGNIQKLRFLRLNNNNLTGTIPMSLTTINELELLDLSSNFLRGDIPFNGSFALFRLISFSNNSDLKTRVVLQAPPNSQSPSEKKKKQLIMCIIAFCGGVGGGGGIFTLFACAWWRCRKPQDHISDLPAEEDPKVHLRQLKKFSMHDLQVATYDFSNKNIIGQGAFGKLYKGRLADGSLVAIKRLVIHGGELQFQKEVEMISMAVHRNLLRLRGFCMTQTERFLVYPYMANGSVASCLQARPNTKPALDWVTRKRIAVGSARGLAYLHDHCDPKIIHRNVKAANILLDDKFEAVVGNFGLAKLMGYKNTHVTTAVCGTIGHIAPEYLSSGRSSEKTDVFGYGVMLLELITGKQAYDPARVEVMLLDWVKGLLKDKKLETLVDADLEGNYMDDEVEKLIQVALLCTQVTPSERPNMAEVVRMHEGDGLAERWEEWQKEESSQQQFSHIYNPNIDLIIPDSTCNLSNDQLSGPR